MGSGSLHRAVSAAQIAVLRNGVTARELGAALGMPRSSSYRLVAALVDVGLLQLAPEGDRYVLGPLIPELSGGLIAWQQLRNVCRPFMAELRDQCGETIGLHVIHAEHRVLLDQAESLQEHRWVASNLFVPMPLHAGAAAKMLLALLPPEAREKLARRNRRVAFTKSTPRDPVALMKELERIRAQGFALSTQEVTPGIASVAVPVVATPHSDRPFAVLNLTGPSVRLTDRVQRAHVPRLQAAARRAAKRLNESLSIQREPA